MLPRVRPIWIVCEDGSEYLERFTRFLDGEFDFVAADGADSLIAAAQAGASGVLLDLDFRRTATDRLIDERGETSGARSSDERQRLAETQGILILQKLRSAGCDLPVILCADLDGGQAAYLTQTLAPLHVAPSHEGLLQIAARMRAVQERENG